MEDTLEDFCFLDKLNGTKIIMKGNHDYWWSTKSKTEKFFKKNGIESIKILFNNAYKVGDAAICGTRGWINDDGEPQDELVLLREAGRMDASLKAAVSTGLEPVVFIHYPPIYGNEQNDYILDVMSKYPVKRCFYGHVHGAPCFPKAFQGERDGITYRMVSADYVKFTPVLVQE